MTFEEASQRYVALRQQRDTGQLPDAPFRQLVAQLLVADAQGAYWMLDAETAQWIPYQPPVPYPPAAAPTPYVASPAYPPSAYAAPVQQPGRGFSQGKWDVISLVGNALLAAGWYLYSGMAETKPDYLTCGSMLVLPILLIVLRKPLDGVLQAIQPIRSKIPSMVLAGCCVAVPYLISNYLYTFGVRQFSFMFGSYVLSTIVSFLLMRQPSGRPANQPLGMTAQAGGIR